MSICERCGTENPSGFSFCGACGAPLQALSEPSGRRKIVTALFCDIVGSTALGEELDPEALHDVITHYFDAISRTIERHGGMVQKFAGDAVLAVFGIPRVNEDDALRAVRAAAEIDHVLPSVAAEVGLKLRVRTGVNTGLVMTDVGKTIAVGDAMNVAARLEQAAQPGEILLGAETLRLVRDAVEVEPIPPLMLKGKSAPIPAFRLLSVDPISARVTTRQEGPLVGRDRELQLLMEMWERTVSQSDCHLFTLLGIAGVGKSRLIAELLDHVGGDASVLSGRCLHYGEGITFWPLVEALTPLGERASRVLDLVSRGGAATPEELFYEVRRLLESLASERPVIMHIDDVQWAEPMLVALLEHVVELSRGSPILVICTARPELLEDHAAWGGGKLNTTVQLEPLTDEECEELLDQLPDGLDEEVRENVIRTSGGNPLFLKEMVVLARERGSVDVPPSIQALLAARLEQLNEVERGLLERGAVEGQVFHRSAVLALAGRGSEREVESQLAGLVRKDLIRSAPSYAPGDTAFRFRHLLIRDAAYERLPKATRATLHARYAHWLEATAVDFVEVDEIAGWHLEQAVQHERELGRRVDLGTARSAAQHLYEAGRRAGSRSDAAAARNLLERALPLLPKDDQLGDRVRLELAERLIEVGDLSRADELVSTVEHGHELASPAALTRLEWSILTRPDQAAQAIASKLRSMLAEFARAGDEQGMARAHWVAFWVHWAASRATPAGEQARLAAEHAHTAGDKGLRSRALGWYVATLMYGPQHADAIARELLEMEREDLGPYLAASVEMGRSEVARLSGRFDDARRLMRRGIDGFASLGMRSLVAACAAALARIELTAGNMGAALGEMRRSDAILAEFGERPLRSTTQAMLSRIHQSLGDLDEARVAVELAEELSAPQDVINFAVTHQVRAQLALATGDTAAAESWARSAVEYAFRTDFVSYQAEAKLGLAHVLSAAGRSDDASLEARSALDLFRAKGDAPGCESAQALLEQLVA